MSEFKGFSPKNQFKLLSSLGYEGPEDEAEMGKFIEGSPAVAAKMGRYAEKAAKRIKAIRGFAEGGIVEPPAPKEATSNAIENPQQFVTTPEVASVPQQPDQEITSGVGQDTTKEEASVKTVTDTTTATAPEKQEAATYDASTVTDAVRRETEDLQAAVAAPSTKATVAGQLESLMQDFEGGATPPWASGAMRQAMSVMQQRGMGASSMAGAAVVQAAMESAIAIASQDANINAQFEMQNLANEQQTAIFKTQQNISALFTDQAMVNAAKQFNAASENQTQQFFADLEATTSRFNADQINSILKFNTDQENAIEQFNKTLQSQRDQFNAANDLIIAQANAKWRQTIAVTDTQNQHEANMEAAKTANQLTARALDHIWQQERDIMAFAFQSAENLEDRNLELLLANKSVSASKSADKRSALGYIAGKLLFG